MFHKLLAAIFTTATGLISAGAHAATIAGTYYEDEQSTLCPGGYECDLLFPLGSALTGKTLNLTEISCGGYSTTGVVFGSIAITDNGVNVRREHFFDVERSPQFTSFWNPLNMVIAGGPPRILRVKLRMNGTASTVDYKCNIVGKISTP